jgi:hypothetical protein
MQVDGVWKVRRRDGGKEGRGGGCVWGNGWNEDGMCLCVEDGELGGEVRGGGIEREERVEKEMTDDAKTR